MDNEKIANKLGFESVEEMEKYYDLCRGLFKVGTIMTKELCVREVIDNGWEHLIDAPREYRLEEKIKFDLDGLIESMKFADSENDKKFKELIDFELSELRKCYANRDQRTMR